MKNIFAVMSIFFILVSSCKKEEQFVPQMKKGPIIESTENIPAHEGIGSTGNVNFQIVVPQEVKESWSGVKLTLNDKELNKETELTVDIGEEYKIPETNLSIKVGYFLPDFKMIGNIITSASNNPENPSAGVIIYEDGKKIYPPKGKWGWLYAKFPNIHSFQHERFGLTLKEGIRR